MEQGLPLIIYANGVAEEGHGKPGICYARDGVDFVKVLEFRPGENKLWGQQGLRHVDDPHFETHPDARKQGAWDYCKGYAYSFAVAEEVDVEARIVELAGKYGDDPKKVAQVLKVKGWNTERVAEVLNRQGATAT